MADNTSVERWIELADFSPGIRQRTMREGDSVSPYPLGAARTTNTYRCIVLPGGGLGPLPKRTAGYNRGGIEGTLSRVQGSVYRVSGFHVTGPILVAGAPGPAVEAHFAFEYNYDSDNNGSFDQRRWRWERLRMWEASPTLDTIRTINSAETSPPNTYRGTYFTDYRAHLTDPLLVGTPFVSAAWYAGGGGFEEVWDVFPDPAALTSNGRAAIATDKSLQRLVQHQGRLLGFEQIGHSHGTPGSWSSDEQVWWTNVNRTTLASSSASMFSQGQMTGYGVAGSTSAQELIAIKHKGGGLTVSGDLDDPTIIALPGIPGTGGYECIGVYTPVGFVYGIKNGGVYAWQGGDAARCLSPQLEDDFWVVPTSFNNYQGRFEVWRDWVVCPAGWMYDTLSESWWRMDDQADYTHFQSCINPVDRYLYSMPQESATPTMSVFDRTVPATSFSWESQPFLITDSDHFNDVRAVIVVIQGSGTVTLEFTGANGATATCVFNATSTSMAQMQRQDMTLRGTSIRCRIVSNGGSTAAPLVHKVVFGVRDAVSIENAA